MARSKRLSPQWQAFLLALGLLTRLPVRFAPERPPEAATQGQSALYYPLVGLCLGLLLWLGQWALGNAAPMLAAFALLLLWVGLTGALHLDGLADCVDGYFSGHQRADAGERRSKTLAVMGEPACGAMAVVALVLLLLGKWVALSALLSIDGQAGLGLHYWLLLLALPRTLLLVYIVTTDYARPGGMADGLKAHLSVRASLWVVALATLVSLVVLPLDLAVLMLVLLGLLWWGWRHLWQRQIGGFTGDCLGALVELSELLLLFVWALVLSS